MDMRTCYVIRVGILCLFTRTECQTIQDISQLHDTLMSGYNKNVKPSVDQSKPVIVNMTFELVSIRELDEIMGKPSIVGMLWLWWEDPRLTWNPFAYNKTFTTRLPMKEVWKPDLIIAQPVDATKAVGFDHYWYPVRYFYNGIAVWTPGDVMTTSCYIDVTYYPFDTQLCEVTFIPWGALLDDIYLHAAEKEVSLKFFTSNGEWSLERATTRNGVIDNMSSTYTVTLELRRRPTFVIVNIILPIMFMGFLNVLVFMLPASSGERVSYAITVLLAIAVFLTLVGDNMPKTSQSMSKICYFLLTNLVLSSFIMIVTILNLKMYHKDSNDTVPQWLAIAVRKVKCKNKPENLKDKDLINKNENWFEKIESLLKCKKLDEHTKVQELKLENDITQECKDIKDELEVEQLALPSYAEDEVEPVTWQDVSYATDIVFGVASCLALVISAATFLIIVATQSVPGTTTKM